LTSVFTLRQKIRYYTCGRGGAAEILACVYSVTPLLAITIESI